MSQKNKLKMELVKIYLQKESEYTEKESDGFYSAAEGSPEKEEFRKLVLRNRLDFAEIWNSVSNCYNKTKV